MWAERRLTIGNTNTIYIFLRMPELSGGGMMGHVARSDAL